MNNILNTKTIFTIIYFYFCWSLGINAAQFYTGGGLLNLVGIPDAFLTAFYSAYQPSFWLPHAYSELEIKFGLSALLPAMMLYLELIKPKKNYRKGEEYGSAKFGKTTDIKEIMDKEFQNNIILSQTEKISIDDREIGLNGNVLVVGGSGSGKTRGMIKPNLLQMHSSYIVTDPKGTVLNEVGQALANNGYEIKTLNLINMGDSNKYNPFAYISNKHPEQDILMLVNILMKNTTGQGEKQHEDFWVKAERLLYTALIAYLYYEGAPHEKNIGTLVYLLQNFEVRENDENFKNAIDYMFEELEEKNPDHFALRQYKSFKLAAGKTAKSILISCAARLAPFDIAEVRNLTEEDELELDTYGTRKTALFVITSDTDDTFNFLAAMMYSQMFNCLTKIAYDDYGGRLPIHVRCLLDEFANIGYIPNFEKIISVIRSRNMSAMIILQGLSQLKTSYKDIANTIIGNCDSFVYLGGKEEDTLKSVVELLGKETIDNLMINESRGKDRSTSLNNTILGRELMTKDELARMPREKCIVHIKGYSAFYSNKYDLTKHPNYKDTGDADKTKIYKFKSTLELEQEKTAQYLAEFKAVEEIDLSHIDFEQLA